MASINTKEDEEVIKIIHDLKTPIIGQITALESFLTTTSNKISQEEKELIQLTLNSCNQMQKIIEAFNLVNKLKFDSLRLNYEKFNVIDVINKSIESIRILLKYYELDLKINFDNEKEKEKEIIINSDKTQIKRVIDILLSNAIHYGYKNTIIEIDATKIKINNKDYFEFSIKNESQYISNETLKKIFSDNKMKTSLYNKTTTSLQLYLSKKIIETHGGEFIAKSSPEEINVFGFKVPVD